MTDCVKNLCFSGWNPPPGNRRLQGDLFYLEIETLEGLRLHVTSSPEGFYVNESTHNKFNPKAHSKFTCEYTLVGLMNQVFAIENIYWKMLK